ncbi:MAG: MarR family winged helix-turn-helix transcriptional regulator [Parvibaculales bacterium]
MQTKQENHSPSDVKPAPNEEDLTRAIEMLFFAYRDFVTLSDSLLSEYGFGRAHHRILHFVLRHKGISVANLLGILQITKQSLARVLRELIESGYIEQQMGEKDRRKRLLFLTTKGEVLANKLLSLQQQQLREALSQTGPLLFTHWQDFMQALCKEDYPLPSR